MLVRPSDYLAEEVPGRIIGTESEMTIQNYYLEGDELVAVNVHDYIGRAAVEAAGFVVVNGFLDTGGHIKIDAGDTIEYSAPEGLGPAEAAQHDRYGIEVVQSIVRASGKKHSGLHRVAGTFLEQKDNKHVVPQYGATNGFHDNFLIPRFLLEDPDLLRDVMGSHLATRMWAMGGALRSKGFVLSQKLWGIGAPVQVGFKGRERVDAGEKPLAVVLTNLIDHDVLGRYEGWARFEDRSPDPSPDEEMTELRLAATSLSLRLIEHAAKLDTDRASGRIRLLESLKLRNPVEAAHRFAGDLTLQETVELANGRRVTAANVQETLVDFVEELSGRVLLPEDEFRGMFSWPERVNVLQSCSPDKGVYVPSSGALLFARRHKHLLKHFEPKELKVTNEPAAQENLRWDRADPEGGGMRYQRALVARRGQVWPGRPKPPTTRGAVRGRMIKSGKATSAEWTSVDQGKRAESLVNPYKTRRSARKAA